MRKKCLVLVAFLSVLAVAEPGARYLIITTDALAGAIQPLANWKHASGMMCRVTPLSQVGYDTTAIRNYVRNAYNTWPVKPEFVLLVGAPNVFPARYYAGPWAYASDNIYGDMVGDLRMEVPVGRFPAKSVSQLEVMVAKTLAYERYPDLADSNWMRRMTTVVGDSNDNDWPTYWADVRNAARLAGEAGFVRCDSFGAMRGHTASNVVGSVTGGTGLVLYRGTAQANWRTPFAVNPALTGNGNKLPIVISITCETMTLTPGESMVGEAWVKTGTVGNLKGAVAFFGNTHSAARVAQVRSTVARGFFAGLFTEKKHKLGHVMIRAKQELYQYYPSCTSDYRGFNLLGDPDLSVWTAVPRKLDVLMPYEIAAEPQQLEVTVRHKLTLVADALVCASMGSSVYSYGYTNSQGVVTLDVAPTDTGRIRVVVTGQNCYPCDTVIRVVPQTGLEEQAGRTPSGRPGLAASPTVFGRSTKLSWSLPLAGAGVEILDARGRLVASIPAVAGTAAEWNGLDISGRPARRGVYFCTLRDARGSAVGRVKVTKTR